MQLANNTATVLTINDRWHGQDDTVAVVYDGVRWLVFNYVKIMLQVVVCLLDLGGKKNMLPFLSKSQTCLSGYHCQLANYLVESHELRGSVLFGLIKRLEADLCRRFCCVCEWTRDCIQVMGPNSHQAPFPAFI